MPANGSTFLGLIDKANEKSKKRTAHCSNDSKLQQ